jgi:hypothetical protein
MPNRFRGITIRVNDGNHRMPSLRASFTAMASLFGRSQKDRQAARHDLMPAGWPASACVRVQLDDFFFGSSS